jgi:hypothetical protein
MNETETLQSESDLIPLGLIAAESGNTVAWVAIRFGDSVVLDDLGMRAINATEARAFFAERAEEKARRVEEQRRRAEEGRKRPVVVGVPAMEGVTPYESMIAATGLQTPAQEFGGREAPNFIEEQLDASARALAEKRRQTALDKERIAEKMREDLG